tara:strand:+ start:365 stop:991 length:627 start_codon:yes stop_codon:yes gene_type:complete
MAIIKGLHARLLAENLELALDRLRYAFFDNNRPYNLNLIAVRNRSGSSDKFDDVLFVVFRDKDKEWEVRSYEITTEPGPRILRKPINEKGTAILVPGQYRSVYKIDTHGGKNRHIALCQRNGKVWVHRDDDRDGKPDEKLVMEHGMFGINIHRHAREDEKEYVLGSSAGCQVFKSSRQFAQFMELCNQAADIYGNSFTYTLLEEKELA